MLSKSKVVNIYPWEITSCLRKQCITGSEGTTIPSLLYYTWECHRHDTEAELEDTIDGILLSTTLYCMTVNKMDFN